MATALCEQSYASITVADIVRIARVSKRTYYEHFATREACYLATYDAVSELLLVRIEAAAASEFPVHERLMAAADAYLSALQEMPALARTFFLEIQLAGPDALLARRKVHQRFAAVLRTLVRKGQRGGASVQPLSADMAVAVVGGINELLMLRIEARKLDELRQLRASVVALFEAVLRPSETTVVARKTAGKLVVS
jgi:AcrR family transcriptional regulator